MSGFLDVPPVPAAIVITDDKGGLVEKYQLAALRYNILNRRIIIDGSCRSACVLALSVRNICITPNAVVKFHHAYEQKTGILRPDVTKVMVNSLPMAVQIAVQGKITKNYNEATTLDYSKLISLGYRSCQADNGVAPYKEPSRHIVRHSRPSALKFATKIIPYPLYAAPTVVNQVSAKIMPSSKIFLW